jgi:hypothetical protein
LARKLNESFGHGDRRVRDADVSPVAESNPDADVPPRFGEV